MIPLLQTLLCVRGDGRRRQRLFDAGSLHLLVLAPNFFEVSKLLVQLLLDLLALKALWQQQHQYRTNA
jgi:hypothetical protein